MVRPAGWGGRGLAGCRVARSGAGALMGCCALPWAGSSQPLGPFACEGPAFSEGELLLSSCPSGVELCPPVCVSPPAPILKPE